MCCAYTVVVCMFVDFGDGDDGVAIAVAVDADVVGFCIRLCFYIFM